MRAPGRSDAALACALLLTWPAGCSSVGSPRPAATAAAPRPASRGSLAQAAPFGDFGEPAPATAAKPETAEAGVRPSAWSRLRGAINRPHSQAIPLPMSAENAGENGDAERPYPSADGRDF